MGSNKNRISSFIDNRLFEAYRASVEHFGTTDLVLVFNEEREVDPVDAFNRKRFIEDPEAPGFLKEKMSKPATEVETNLKHGEVAFWFLVFYATGESECAAIKATLLGPGGNA